MIQDKFGQLVYSDCDLIDMIMQGHDITAVEHMWVDVSVDLGTAGDLLETVPQLYHYPEEQLTQLSVAEFDQQNQQQWFMPEEYQNMDIAEHVLKLCNSDAQLQRVGEELLLYQERNLFDLLKYLKYLVDIMQQHEIIWGVGRGSSVASYVLYLLEVHRVDSLHYQLDPREFLR